MRQTRTVVVLGGWLVLFAPGVQAGSGEATPVWDREEIRRTVAGRDFSAVRALADRAEAAWHEAAVVIYFRNMATLCEAIADTSDIKPIEYVLLHDFIGRALAKPYSVGVCSLAEVWGAKLRLALILLRRAPFFSSLDPDAFAALRSRSAALLALFCAQVNSAYIRAYRPKPTFMNIAPPINLGNELLIAGMAPEGIVNPVSRKAYEERLEENKRNCAENCTQAFLESTVTGYFPSIISWLQLLYSRGPADQRELTAYLSMASLDAWVRDKPQRGGPEGQGMKK
jgi:hypothetical protein